ncbi:glycosyltransferase family 2 protein [Microbacterium timonense]|uniref:glycosyltransferase family 2 protein n=1 Tax=Microbacterium timonense TaxID=2086576 RepID=UPI000D0FBAC2|nr:glycosyltransferase family A protein [Microbacterium timonense]
MPYRVSVVVRTKNRPALLGRALEDIASQSFGEAEVMVVNDGGVRGEVDAVVRSSSIADRVSVIDTVAPGGRCAAANLGVRSTSAEYIVLHDDDDLWHPDFLAKTVALLDASPQDAGVMVATEILEEELRDGEWVETARMPYWAGLTHVDFTSLLEINRAVPISFVYRRAVHDELGGYDESLETVEDWEFYLRLTARHPVAFLGGVPLAYWMHRPAAEGADGNSMFELQGAHARDDLAVRDRELTRWVRENGPGLPLYIALVEKNLRAEMERQHQELLAALSRRDEDLAREIYARHPVWRRLRRLRRRK